MSTDKNQPRTKDSQENLVQTESTSPPHIASNFQEIQLGVGIGTRYSAGRERTQTERQIKATKNCELFRKELESWAEQIVETENADRYRQYMKILHKV